MGLSITNVLNQRIHHGSAGSQALGSEPSATADRQMQKSLVWAHHGHLH